MYPIENKRKLTEEELKQVTGGHESEYIGLDPSDVFNPMNGIKDTRDELNKKKREQEE